jgi:hypothetical protein
LSAIFRACSLCVGGMLGYGGGKAK